MRKPYLCLTLIIGLLLLLPMSAYGAVATQDDGAYTGEATALNFGLGLDVEGDYSTKTVAILDEGIQYLTVRITNAQVKTLRATPVEIIPAPTGGDHFIEVISCKMLYDYHGTSAFTESSDDLILTYNNYVGARNIGTAIDTTGWIDGTTDRVREWVDTCSDSFTVCEIINKNVALKNVGDGEIAGNALGDNIITVYIAYRVIKLGYGDCTLGY